MPYDEWGNWIEEPVYDSPPAPEPAPAPAPSAGQPPGYQGLEFWNNQGQSPIGSFEQGATNGGLAPGWVRTANGYEQQPQIRLPPQNYSYDFGDAPQFDGPDFSYDQFVFDQKYKVPTAEDLYTDPSYITRRDEGAKALEQSAAGKGTLRTGGTLKDILNYGQQFASREYGNVYDRGWNRYVTDYEQSADKYRTNYGVSRDVFDRQYQEARDKFAPQMFQYQMEADAEKSRAENEWQREWDAFVYGTSD